MLPQKEIKLYEEITTCISQEKKTSDSYKPEKYQPSQENLSTFIDHYQKIIMGMKIQLNEIKEEK